MNLAPPFVLRSALGGLARSRVRKLFPLLSLDLRACSLTPPFVVRISTGGLAHSRVRMLFLALYLGLRARSLTPMLVTKQHRIIGQDEARALNSDG